MQRGIQGRGAEGGGEALRIVVKVTDYFIFQQNALKKNTHKNLHHRIKQLKTIFFKC